MKALQIAASIWLIMATCFIIDHDKWIRNHEKPALEYTVHCSNGGFRIHLASDREAIQLGDSGNAIYRITCDGIVIWGNREHN